MQLQSDLRFTLAYTKQCTEQHQVYHKQPLSRGKSNCLFETWKVFLEKGSHAQIQCMILITYFVAHGWVIRRLSHHFTESVNSMSGKCSQSFERLYACTKKGAF